MAVIKHETVAVLLLLIIYFSAVQCNSCGSEQESKLTSERQGRNFIDPPPLEYRQDLCQYPPCIRKCCERHSFKNDTTGKCDDWSQTDTSWKFPVYGNITWELCPPRSPFDRFQVLYGYTCTDKYRLEPEEVNERFMVLADGSLLLPKMDSKFAVDQYCLEYFSDVEMVLPLVCFPEDEDQIVTPMMIYPVGLLLSIVFLVITLIVYAALPKLRNLHGYLVIGHVVALIFAFSGLAYVQLTPFAFELDSWLCRAAAYNLQFFFTAAFLWLNVISFDVYKMFRLHVVPTNEKRDRRQLLIYSVYAWGGAAALLLIIGFMDMAPFVPAESVFKPNFGEHRCWYNNEKVTAFIYFFGPISALLLCNLVLFGITAVRIFRLRRGTAVLNAPRRNRQLLFSLYLKLMLVMGLTWIMEVVSWSTTGLVHSWVWIVTDVCNSLQGLAIFLIFVWKPTVRRMIAVRCAIACGKHVENQNHRDMSCRGGSMRTATGLSTLF